MVRKSSLTTSAERIGEWRFAPSLLRLNHQCLTVLRRTVRATAPLEGCALLIGQKSSSKTWAVERVWPCCNVWSPEIDAFAEDSSSSGRINPSRRTRFAIDPREQLAAQRWTRQRCQCLIGVAHFHSTRGSHPSVEDCRWGECRTLMLIDSVAEGLKAWWLGVDRQAIGVPIEITDKSPSMFRLD